METNIYRVSFGPSRHATPTQPMFWSDIGWRLQFDGVDLPDAYEVYFAHPGDTEAKRSIGGPDGALVLNEYLTSGKELLFWVYVPAGTDAAHTKYTGRIPVNPRPAASEAEPTPEQADVITQTIAALNAAVEQTAEDVEAADLSAQEAAAQADRAEEAQGAAEAAQTAAETAERNAALSATAAGESEAAARTYAANAARSESNAEGYAEDALESANLADERSRDAADSAEAAAGKAGEAGAAKEAILNMGATATTLPEGSTATVTKTTDQQGAVTLAFGIPRGATGATGSQGDPGRGIASIVKTSTSGLVDTYTVTYTDGTPWTYQVTNGEKGDPGEGVAPGGTTGQMLVKKTDTDYDTDWVDPPEGEVTQAEFDALQTYVEDMSPVVTVGPSTIASVDDAAPLKAEKVEIAIEPVQDLHGYEAPWPAGGGKNLMPPPTSVEAYGADLRVTNNNGQLTISGNVQSGDAVIARIEPTVINEGHILAFLNSFIGATIYFLNGQTNVDYFSASTTNRVVNTSSMATLYGKTFNAYRIMFSSAQALTNASFALMAAADGTDMTTFAPYSNICPISGWTGANVEARGKNMLDPATIRGGYFVRAGNASESSPLGSETANSAWSCSGFIPVLALAQYTTVVPKYTQASAAGLVFYDESKNAISGVTTILQNDAVYTFTTPSDCKYVRFSWNNADGDNALIAAGIATSYEPYQGSTTSISWADEAGTVYGGTLTWEKDGSVTLTVDRAEVDLGDLTWTALALGNNVFYAPVTGAIGNTGTGNIPNLICSWYKTVAAMSANAWSQLTQDKVVSLGYDSARVYIRDASYADTATFKSAMSGVQLVYELSTPVIYTLTPTEALTLLRGSNNLWADTGNTALTYRQDVAILLKKLTSQVAALNTAVANT